MWLELLQFLFGHILREVPYAPADMREVVNEESSTQDTNTVLQWHGDSAAAGTAAAMTLTRLSPTQYDTIHDMYEVHMIPGIRYLTEATVYNAGCGTCHRKNRGISKEPL